MQFAKVDGVLINLERIAYTRRLSTDGTLQVIFSGVEDDFVYFTGETADTLEAYLASQAIDLRMSVEVAREFRRP